ncbi:hypothetical protein HPB48_020090 [Haemaphysalis longicornis]|uniref:Uncharacterized protein n=1 Tax=Haemaphysalis longicornis TaxID=44386 RepID=A0A9J6GQF2_HAELO|nr:hypothetical protein HPB48_020090 [Haemaphysalis longicornis]
MPSVASLSNTLLQRTLITKTKPLIITLQKTNGDFYIPGYDRDVQPSIITNKKGTQPLSTPPTMTITYVEKTLPTIQLDTTHEDG